MQEYLVHIEINLTIDIAEQRKAGLYSLERIRGEELIQAGTLRRIWRIPGKQANVGIWEASDATALHSAIASLPLYPWMTVSVTELASHPLEEGHPASNANAVARESEKADDAAASQQED